MSDKPTTTVHIHHQGQRIDLPADKCADIVRVGQAEIARTATPLTSWASEFCPTCRQHKSVMGMPCSDAWHLENTSSAPPVGEDEAAVELKIAKAEAMVSALCKPRGTAGKREWTMSIPARPDYDPDLVIADALHSADRTITTLRARVVELERHNSDLAVSVQHYGAERDRALADLDHTKGRLAIMESLHRSNTERGQTVFGMAAALAATEKERDAARAEVERLKARKVKLPDRAGSESRPDYGEFKRGFNAGLDECADAIRAAGVDCE